LVGYYVGKSDDVTDEGRYIMENVLNFMALKSTSKFRLSAWLRENFLQIQHYFSSNRVFPMMTSLNDDITLKIFITLIIRKHFYHNQNPIFE